MTHECLPKDIVAKSYDLYLKPNFETYKFEGKVTAHVVVSQPSKTIVVNAAELEIEEKSIRVGSGQELEKTEYKKKEEQYVMTFKDTISEDTTLEMSFVGTLNDQMRGFYRSKYKNIEGEEKYMATTQFEPSDARRCFPCYDEPSCKAVFNISLEVPMGLTALSNMNEVSIKHIEEEKTKLVTFAPTPIMSTYLVAFCIGEFDFVQGCSKNGLPIRVFTPLGKSQQGKFALEVTERVIPLYEDFFGIDYPLPKLDLIAIPDFAAGAMENWGLVTFRETAVLIDENKLSLHSKTWVALVVCHECAHMWFGNLVTMEWWNGLWLNEAFATWVEYYAVSQLFPEWEIFNQFVELDFGRAQDLDSLESTHPVEVECPSFREVDEIFDAISYSKGCALIRMLADHISLDKLKEGLRIYLNFHKYGNAVTPDLWAAFSKVTRKNVSVLMDNWTKQQGYPVVTVTKKSETRVHLKQQLFLKTGEKPSDSIWKIPLTYVTSQAPHKPVRVLFTEREMELNIPGNIDWIKFNYNQTGFYRVNYEDSSMVEALSAAVKNKSLGAIDRLGVQSDLCALALSGYCSAKAALTLLQGYDNEDDYTVLKSVVSNLGSFYDIVKLDKDASKKFKAFARSLVINEYKKLQWNPVQGENDLTNMKRSLVIAALVNYDDEAVLKSALEKFDNYSDFSADLASSIFKSKIKLGDSNDFEEVLDIYRKTDDNAERVRVLGSIGVTKDQTKVDFILSDAFIFDTVKSQDGFYPLSSLSSNPIAVDALWKWLSADFERVQTHLGSHFLVGRVIKCCTGSFNTQEQKDAVASFFKGKDLPQLTRTIAQAVEVISLNMLYKERCLKDIQSFLE